MEGRGLGGGVSGCGGAWFGGAASGDYREGGGAASPPGVSETGLERSAWRFRRVPLALDGGWGGRDLEE